MPDQHEAVTRRWTPEDDQALRARYPHEPTAALARALRRSRCATYARARTLGLAKSAAYMASPDACWLRRGDRDGRRFGFAPGHVPANKGLRRPGWSRGRMRDTQFQKGQIGTRFMPIGSTRLSNGYVYRKVRDTRDVPWTQNWALEHRLVWEAAHGPVPAGYVLRFRDGDGTHTAVENLELVTRGALARDLIGRNTVHRFPPALVAAIHLLGDLTRQINTRTKPDACPQQD